jgi:circadian clock protein KaiC
MARNRRRSPPQEGQAVAKVSSGIRGLDEITGGGLPSGRPVLVCGGRGCGMTLFAMELLVRGAAEPGVRMSFEEVLFGLDLREGA